MEPISQTAALIQELSEFYDVDLLDDIRQKVAAVEELVPDLVGLSLAYLDAGLAFTLVATDFDIAVLDAVQYVAGGPCVDAAAANEIRTFDSEEPDDEDQWRVFAKATAAKAVASTLTLPVLNGDTVIGSVNLYAASSRAFDGLQEDIAAIFDAWAPGAIANADLSFLTRREAEAAPERLHAARRIDAAVGWLMSSRGIEADAARALLEHSAQRAGVTPEELAETLLEGLDPPEEG